MHMCPYVSICIHIYTCIPICIHMYTYASTCVPCPVPHAPCPMSRVRCPVSCVPCPVSRVPSHVPSRVPSRPVPSHAKMEKILLKKQSEAIYDLKRKLHLCLFLRIPCHGPWPGHGPGMPGDSFWKDLCFKIEGPICLFLRIPWHGLAHEPMGSHGHANRPWAWPMAWDP